MVRRTVEFVASSHYEKMPSGREAAYNPGVEFIDDEFDSGNGHGAEEDNFSQNSTSTSPPVSGRPVGRIMGLDVGSRRIGIAVSDLLGITAQGLDTLQRQNKRTDFEALRRLIKEFKVREIVVGLPLRMSGAEGIQAEKMQGFAEELRRKFKLPVHLWDERLTSAEANRLLRETDLSIEKRGKAVDRMAAILILQGWMQAQQGR